MTHPLLLQNSHDDYLKIVWDYSQKQTGHSLVLCLASCKRREGTSTVLFNMALALANTSPDKKVLIVDGNMKWPALHHFFNTSPQDPGLSDILNKTASLEDVIKHDRDGVIHFIPAGQKTPHPISLFSSSVFTETLATMRAQYDYILFDSAALVAGPETIVLGKQVDNLLLVLEAEKTRWEVAKHVVKELKQSHVLISGIIFNKKRMYIPSLVYRFLLAN